MPINLHRQHDRSMNIIIVAKGRCVKCFLFARRKEQLKDYIVSKQLHRMFSFSKTKTANISIYYDFTL